MFLEVLQLRGHMQQAQERLQLLKRVPEFAEDVRLLMVEAAQQLANEHEEESERLSAVRDALYTYQELAQLHGRSDRLAQGQSAALAILGKFNEARAALAGLTTAAESTLVLDAALNAPEFNRQLQ